MTLKYVCATEKWGGMLRQGTAGEAREGFSEELTFKVSQSEDIKQGWRWGQRSAEGEAGRAGPAKGP